MKEWQPIETAPKDGTKVFLCEKYSDVPFVGRWMTFAGRGEWTADRQHLNVDGDATIVDWFEQDGITHWQPIMEMPEFGKS